MVGKKIILGICGSIAAYKSALIVRGLIKAGAEVRVLMTPAATDFISPLTLATLSKNEVVSSVHDEASWNNHVELGLWADAMLIAPVTATTLGKLAHGICDSAIVAVYLSARCPVFFAPAMDVDMWQHPSVRNNVFLLQSYGNHLIDVGTGELASGLNGAGRLAEPEDILKVLETHFSPSQSLAGKRVLVTAGPTYEDLDPVRYLGNRSTGKMGIALAEAAAARGARVDLVLGPSTLSTQVAGITTHNVRTALAMREACFYVRDKIDFFFLAAAVADYRPAEVAREKIKKKDGPLHLELLRNPDIAAELGREKESHQRLVGFALETEDGAANARRKLTTKNLDLIVLNSPRDAGAAFGHDTNRVSIIDHNKQVDFGLKTKREVAEDILDAVAALATTA